MARWMDRLAENGGNFIRVWLSNASFDVEHARSGEYDGAKAERIDRMLDLARRRGIRVKMCLEHFRHFGTREQAWSSKPLHLRERGGPAKDIADFFDGEASRAQFKRKLAWYANRYGSDPTVFGWELWNEVNTVAGGDGMAWTEAMLADLHRLFPRNLCLQSLGSFDAARIRPAYQRLSAMPGNDVAQVHRYLDLGASLEICKGPVVDLAADAVREILAFRPGRPVLLAQSGAAEHPRLKVYVLAGRSVWLVWCRDRRNTWATELRDGRAPETIEGATISLPARVSGRPSASRDRSTDRPSDPRRRPGTEATASGSPRRRGS